MCACSALSHVQLSVSPWIIVCRAPQGSVGSSRREYWSELPGPSPGDLPNPGIKPGSRALQADSLLSEPMLQYKIKGFFLKKKEIISFIL